MDKEALKRAMLKAQTTQHDLIHAQDDLANTEIEGKSNDGKVMVTMSAAGDFHKVVIDPSALVDGIHALENGVLEALNNVSFKAAEMTKVELEKITKNIGL